MKQVVEGVVNSYCDYDLYSYISSFVTSPPTETAGERSHGPLNRDKGFLVSIVVPRETYLATTSSKVAHHVHPELGNHGIRKQDWECGCGRGVAITRRADKYQGR